MKAAREGLLKRGVKMKDYRVYASDCIREDFRAKNDVHAVYLATKEHPESLVAVYRVHSNGTAVCIFESEEE
jgi:hypothetical protein